MRDEQDGRAPRRLIEQRDGSETARLLASVARPVAVPPGARQRVITGALGRRAEPGRGWQWFAVAGAAAALLLWWAVGARGPAEPFARVASSEGEVHIEEPGRSVAAEAGAALGDGARMATGAEGGAAVRFADLELRLGRTTGAILRRRGAGGVEIGLERGEISLVVGRRPPDRPVVVGAGAYSVVVVGTVFSVRAADGAVEVKVAEGRVRVAGPGVEQLLGAGEVWSSPARAAARAPAPPASVARPPIAPGVSPPARAPRVQRLAADREEPARRAPTRRLEIARANSPRRAPHAPSVAPDQSALRPPTPASALPPTAPLPTPAPARPSPAPAPTSAPALPPRAPAHAPLPPVAPAPPAPDAYGEAQALASRGHYAEAAASFERLSGSGARAELALYERGLLLLKKLDEPGRARRVFLEHQRRFPQSALAPEVAISLIEASLQAKELTEAAREIDAFLARHPASERRDELRLLRANLARDGGDCARAEREYEALAQGAGQHAEAALHAWAYCRDRLGDQAGARARLREYLRRFPTGRHRRDVEQALGVTP